MKNTARLIPILLIVTSAIAGLLFFFFVHSFTLPSGVDGYYYIKQIKYFWQTGQLYFQDKSLAYILPFLLQSFLKNELLSFQLATSIALTLMFAGQLMLSHVFLPRNGKRVWIGAGVAILFCVFNVSVYELAMTYYKNTFAIASFTFGFLFLIYFIQNRSKKYVFASLGFFALALLSHKSTILWLACTAVAAAWVGRGSFVSRFTKQYVFIFLGLLVFAVGGFFVFFNNALTVITVLFDSLKLNWTYPAWLYSQGLMRDFIFLGYLMELAVLALLIFQIKGLRRDKLSAVETFVCTFYILLFLLTVLPIYKSGGGELGYRLLLCTTAMLGPCLVFLFSQSKKYFSATEFLLGLMLFQFIYASALERNFHDYSKMDAAMLELTAIVHENDYLIAHHGLEFYIDYKTDIRARLFLPDQTVTGETYRVIYVPYGSLPWIMAKGAIYKDKKLQLERDYFLLTQKDWAKIKQSVKVPDTWQNADLVNPGNVYH